MELTDRGPVIESNVIVGGRGSGKTHTVMTEIHDRIIAGERADILVVFPQMSHLTWWGNAWKARFPHLPMPDYTSMKSMERVRGKRVKHIFVEDIDHDPDGIYAEKLQYLYPCIVGDGSITFTYSPIVGNNIAHREPPLASDLRYTVRQKAEIIRRIYDEYHTNRMVEYINNEKQTTN